MEPVAHLRFHSGEKVIPITRPGVVQSHSRALHASGLVIKT